MFIQLAGTYKEKFRVFGITITSKKGAFAFAIPAPVNEWKPVTTAQGPFVFSAALVNGKAVVSASLFGVLKKTLLSVTLVPFGAPSKFKVSLDKANEIEGTVLVTSTITGGTAKTVDVAHN